MATTAPDWHLFRAFLAVAREGSLSSAARVLGTTQPTMGRQVAALEAALGVKLFTRSLDGLSPTEAGLRLIPWAEAMAAAAEAAQRIASGEVDEERATVRITASEVWLVMHRDLRSSRRIRLLFDHLATRLPANAQSSCLEK